MSFKLNTIYTRPIEKTRTGISCLWEESYFEEAVYNVFIITDSLGGKIKPLFIKTNDRQTALLPIQNGYYVIHGQYDTNANMKFFIGKVITIGEDDVQYKIISTIKNTKWDNFITELGKVISVIKASMISSEIHKPIYVHNTTITMTSKKYIMSLDVESDGLFGRPVSAAIIIYDHNKEIVNSVHVAVNNPNLVNPWAIENLNTNFSHRDDILKVSSTNNMIVVARKFYENYIKHSMVLTDIPFPVDTGFIRLLANDIVDRSPYPIVDLASVLISKGYNFNIPRTELYKSLNDGIPLEGQVHDPYFDAVLTAQIYFKLMDM